MIKNVFILLLASNALVVAGLLLTVFVRRLAAVWQSRTKAATAANLPRPIFENGGHGARPILGRTLEKV